MADIAVPASLQRAHEARRPRRWPAAAPFLYLAPMVLLLGAFTYWPFVGTIYLSLVEWNLAPGTSPRKPVGEIHSPLPWPEEPTWRNFVTLFATVPFAAYLWNSVATTALRVAGQMAVALLAAYAFARWEFRGREPLFAAMLGAMMLPHQLTMLPIYVMIAELGWFDTWQALVVPNLAMPFAAFLLRQHIRAFPRALFDAATMDGAGHWRCLWLVVVPNLGPVLSALAIVLSIECWNEYFWPLLVTDSPASRTIQVGLRSFLDEQFSDYGALMAGATVASLPALALFFAFQRRVLETFAASGMKG